MILGSRAQKHACPLLLIILDLPLAYLSTEIEALSNAHLYHNKIKKVNCEDCKYIDGWLWLRATVNYK